MKILILTTVKNTVARNRNSNSHDRIFTVTRTFSNPFSFLTTMMVRTFSRPYFYGGEILPTTVYTTYINPLHSRHARTVGDRLKSAVTPTEHERDKTENQKKKE